MRCSGPTVVLLLVSFAIWMAGAGETRADVPVFLFIAQGRIWYWWAIPVAIVIEAFVFRFGLRTGWRRSFMIAFAVNAVSGLSGVPLYPVIGIILYPILAPLVTGIFGYGVLVEAAATFSMLVLLDTSVEFLALALLFRFFRVPGSPLTALWMAVANALSTILLLAVITAVPDLPSIAPDADRPDRLTAEELEEVAGSYAEELAFMGEMGSSLWQSESVSEITIDPAWLRLTQNAAQSLEFIDLAVVTRSGQKLEDVAVTFLVGSDDGRDPSLWLFSESDDGYGCLATGQCFARSTSADGAVTYRTEMSYRATRYSFGILATFAAPE